MQVCVFVFTGIVELIADLLLQKALGLVSMTTDIWTDQNMRAWMAVTGHWIQERSGAFELRSDMIAFKYLPGTHTGEVIGNTLVKVAERVNIIQNVSFAE